MYFQKFQKLSIELKTKTKTYNNILIRPKFPKDYNTNIIQFFVCIPSNKPLFAVEKSFAFFFFKAAQIK